MKKMFLADRVIETSRPAFVMGVVNATPDSLWKESRGGAENALRLIDEGADILDIGGESSRPGSEYVSEEEELRRIIPVIEAVRRRSSIPVSVDTRKKNVMKAAFEAGADILNDISALEDDEELAPFAASVAIPVILMHKRGIPVTMQNDTSYSDVFREVSDYLESRADYAVRSGISSEKIIVDPGIGFGKDLNANVTLIRRCGELCGKKYTVLMALSRKTCIGQMTGRDVEDRLFGTLAADIISVINGAQIVRVHDVKETVDTLSVLSYTI